VPTREQDGFQPDPDAIRKALGPRTRAVMIGSPANPTGVVLKPGLLRALAELPVPVISDEIYHGLTYAGEEHSLSEYTERGLVLNGFSKYFAMTGWRLGYLIFPRELLPPVMKLHQNIMISANDFIQYAGIAAMREAIPICEGYKKEYDRRRLFIVRRLAEIGLPLRYEPAGAFYCFADAGRYGKDSLALARELLEQTGVALTPGIDFGPGGEGYLRFSYARSLEDIADTSRWNEAVATGLAAARLRVDAVINGCSAVEVRPTDDGPAVLDPTALALRLIGAGIDLFEGGDR